MPRMIDLIRQSAIPPNLLRTAAKGALSLPAVEMLEILVLLTANPVVGQQAAMTLAGWDARSLEHVAADPNTAVEVLRYFCTRENARADVLAALATNPGVSPECFVDLASAARGEMLDVLLASSRIQSFAPAMQVVMVNANASPEQRDRAKAYLGAANQAQVTEEHDEVVEAAVAKFMQEHAADIAAEEGRPFTIVGASDSEAEELRKAASAGADSEGVAALKSIAFSARASQVERESPVQKIAKMMVGQRVMLALKGNKDERFLLIRDGARIVSNAVLESPKLTESEIDQFASMKNLHESILRIIGTKPKYLKRYSVVRALTMNPKTPIDVSLGLLPHLLTSDLKNLGRNRDVADTITKAANKMYRDRTLARQS